MKNRHVLPTDKPSRLFLNKINNKILLEDISNPSLKNVLPSGSYQNIYITNDEEIKLNDWCIMLDDLGSLFSNPQHYNDPETQTLNKGLRKIILTTDLELQKDGVQAIDDDFLEWFVKNPSCESVDLDTFSMGNKVLYNVVFPKEEPKPHSFCETPEEKCTMNYCDDNGCQNRKRELVEPKQETLEEVLERLSITDSKKLSIFLDGMIYQQERSYSEEEVLDIFHEWFCYRIDEDFEIKLSFQQWFKQFKNK